jgi:hypothetical protein
MAVVEKLRSARSSEPQKPGRRSVLISRWRCLYWVPLLLGALLGNPDGIAAQAIPAPAIADTLARDEPVRSPRGAFLRSLVVPGWGHAWVGSPVRGGVYFAMETGALWMTLKSRQKLREARQLEQWMRESGQLAPNELFGLTRAREDQVEDWITVAIFLLFFSGADAWVSAHLADFGDRVGASPTAGGALQLQARIPVGGRR